MKHILIPTDFSDNAWSAIVYAVKYFKNDVCTFYLLHANLLNPSPLSSLSDIYIKNIRQQNNLQLEALKQQITDSDANTNHDFKTIVKFVALKEAIKDCIAENTIDLIVMGTKGVTKNKSLFFGSNTIHLVDKIKTCPILIIPDEYDFRPIKQIVFSTDLNRFYSDHEIKIINEFIYDNNAALRVVNIQTKQPISELQFYNLSCLKKGFKDFEVHYHSVPNYDKKAEIISTFIKDLDIDLLIMVNYKHSIIERFLNEPVIKNIGFKPQVPFLVIPDNQ
ncbi:universal stress protein [Olleya sp. HaHaR_3_96]|uniref:universal stress protein n=1 Tax=Olleya sp. HaHaR_3_96 TaxID=2745560 RepID=UPI001C4EA5FB|nr:universal stress protein [Olleya sp. HaHaR_3_96]QXP59274.1 universal stress protein [Olleya sp. HaHaR_3_96]